MEHHGRLRHLIRTGPRPQRVARIAVHTFVTGMAEASHISRGRVNRTGATRFVASAARIDRASLRGHFSRYRGFAGMALQAARVCVRARWHREPLTALRRLVARCTVRLRGMFGVIKFRAKRPEPVELSHRSGCVISVADRAHLAGLRILEMLHVASRAGRMIRLAGKTYL